MWHQTQKSKLSDKDNKLGSRFMIKNPIQFNIVEGRLLAAASGELTFNDIIEHYGALFDVDDFSVGMPAIYDFTAVTQVTGDIAHFEQIARDMGNNAIIDKPSYVAILVNQYNSHVRDIFFAYSRMMDYTQMHVSVFYETRRAEKWLADNTE